MRTSVMSLFIPISLISSFSFYFLSFSSFFALISDYFFRLFPLFRVCCDTNVSHSDRGFSLSGQVSCYY